MRPRIALIRESVLEVLASRASVELGRVAMVRPALEKPCERAESILARHVAEPRAGLIRVRVRSGELVGYLVRGSGGAVWRTASEAQSPEVVAAAEGVEREHGQTSDEARAA